MSSLRFIKAPPRPDHINEVIWNSEWVGLFVGLASVFPQTIGYLGEGDARKFDEKTYLYRSPTPSETMDYVTDTLSEPMWISRDRLVNSCKHSTPPRPVILSWLEEDAQRGR